MDDGPISRRVPLGRTSVQHSLPSRKTIHGMSLGACSCNRLKRERAHKSIPFMLNLQFPSCKPFNEHVDNGRGPLRLSRMSYVPLVWTCVQHTLPHINPFTNTLAHSQMQLWNSKFCPSHHRSAPCVGKPLSE